MAGSGLFSDQSAVKPHLMRGTGGISAEVADLRGDIGNVLAALAAITVEEFTDPAAADAAGLEIATATDNTGERVVTSFLAGGVAALAAYPRTISFTTAGATPADAPATALVTGTDVDGNALTETVSISQTAATVYSTKCFASVTNITYAIADGVAATVSIGFGPTVGLSKALKSRAGAAAVMTEIEAGAVVTTGTFADAATSAPYGSYTPATVPDGSNDYALFYEYDPTA